ARVNRARPLHAGPGERRVLPRHVVAVVEDPGLEPPLVARGDRADLRWTPRLHHAVPELGAARAVAQVDLVADLTRPPRARDDHRDRTQVAFPTSVVPKVRDLVPEQRPDHVLAL